MSTTRRRKILVSYEDLESLNLKRKYVRWPEENLGSTRRNKMTTDANILHPHFLV